MLIGPDRAALEALARHLSLPDICKGAVADGLARQYQ